jgi:hypothetical protein
LVILFSDSWNEAVDQCYGTLQTLPTISIPVAVLGLDLYAVVQYTKFIPRGQEKERDNNVIFLCL